MKNSRLSRRRFSLITFLIGEIWNWKWHHRVCLAEAVWNMHFFTLKGQFQKFDLWSGQVKFRSSPMQINMNVNRSDWTSQVAGHHLRVFILILSRDISEKRMVTSCDFRRPSRDPHHQLQRDHHRWGEVPLFWKIWVVSVSLCKTGSIFTYNREVMKLTWPWITRIKTTSHTFYRYWWPHATLKVSY